MASDFVDALSTLLREELVAGAKDKLPEVDPLVSSIVRSSEGVSADPIGKGYKVKHTIRTSMAGTIQPSTPGAGTRVTETGVAQLPESYGTYPGHQDFVQPGYAQLWFTIARLKGNVHLGVDQLRVSQLPSVDNHIAMIMDGYQKMLAHTDALSFYLDDSARIANIDLAGGSTPKIKQDPDSDGSSHIVECNNDGAAVFDFDYDSTGAVPGVERRIQPGMLVDLYADDTNGLPDGNNKITANGWAMIDYNFDYLDGYKVRFYFQYEADADTFAYSDSVDVGGGGDPHTHNDNVIIVPYKALDDSSGPAHYSRFPCGFKSWIRGSTTVDGSKDNAYLFGPNFSNIDVDSYGSMFKSYVKDVGAALDSTELNKRLMKFRNATGVTPDTILTTDGVLVDVVDTYGGVGPQTQTPFNMGPEAPGNVALGMPNVTYTFGGKTYQMMTSTYMVPGELVAFKRNGNLKRYEPPQAPGLSGSSPSGLNFPSNYDSRVEWLGLASGSDIWMPVYGAGGAPTEGIQAPFDVFYQNGAVEPRGMFLRNITTEMG